MTFPRTQTLDNFQREDFGPPLSEDWSDITDDLHGMQVASNVAVGVDDLSENGDCLLTKFGPNCEAWLTLGEVADNFVLCVLSPITSGRAQSYFVSYEYDTTTLRLGRYNDSGDPLVFRDHVIELSTGDSIGLQLINSELACCYKPVSGEWSQIMRTIDSQTTTPGYILLYSTGNINTFTAVGGGTVAAEGRTVSKFRRLYIDGHDMSKHTINLGPLSVMHPEQPLATFADEVVGTFPGIPRVSIGVLNGVLDNTPDSGLHVIANAGGQRNVILAQGLRHIPMQGDPAFCCVVEQVGYDAVESSVDSTVTVTVPFSGTSATDSTELPGEAWGVLLHPAVAEEDVNIGGGCDNCVDTELGGALFWQLLATDGTVALKVEHSDTVDLQSAYTELVTTDLLDAVGAGYILVERGVSIGRYLRWQIVLDTATSATFVVAFVRSK